MPQWEHIKIHLSELSRRADDIDLLNDMGREGWEMINITMNNVAYLKRQVAEPAPAQSARRKVASARSQDA